MKNRINYFFLVTLVLFVIACNKHERYPDVQVFGHAGMGMDIAYSVYHDNSEQAIDLALSLPTIDGVEMDVRMSKDGTLWLYHENHLEASSDGVGCVAELTDLQLEQVRYKSIHREKLVKLSEILEKLTPGMTFILDIKHWNDCAQAYSDMQRFKDALLAIPDEQKDQLIIDSSYPYWLSALSQTFKVVFSTVSFEDGFEKLKSIPTLHGIMMRSKDISAEQIAQVKGMGKTVYLFEMRSSKMQRATMKKAPTAILADDPRGALVIR
ncbi:MAG: glycerophosphodiester phosphodiesterase, partial [Flavobacteriales bacterium]